MADQLEDVPAELLPHIGDALKGFDHAKLSLGETLPTNLHRANLIRRGALEFLAVPKKGRKK
jgi:hypothetical protein